MICFFFVFIFCFVFCVYSTYISLQYTIPFLFLFDSFVCFLFRAVSCITPLLHRVPVAVYSFVLIHDVYVYFELICSFFIFYLSVTSLFRIQFHTYISLQHARMLNFYFICNNKFYLDVFLSISGSHVFHPLIYESPLFALFISAPKSVKLFTNVEFPFTIAPCDARFPHILALFTSAP